MGVGVGGAGTKVLNSLDLGLSFILFCTFKLWNQLFAPSKWSQFCHALQFYTAFIYSVLQIILVCIDYIVLQIKVKMQSVSSICAPPRFSLKWCFFDLYHYKPDLKARRLLLMSSKHLSSHNYDKSVDEPDGASLCCWCRRASNLLWCFVFLTRAI